MRPVVGEFLYEHMSYHFCVGDVVALLSKHGISDLAIVVSRAGESEKATGYLLCDTYAGNRTDCHFSGPNRIFDVFMMQHGMGNMVFVSGCTVRVREDCLEWLAGTPSKISRGLAEFRKRISRPIPYTGSSVLGNRIL